MLFNTALGHEHHCRNQENHELSVFLDSKNIMLFLVVLGPSKVLSWRGFDGSLVCLQLFAWSGAPSD